MKPPTFSDRFITQNISVGRQELAPRSEAGVNNVRSRIITMHLEPDSVMPARSHRQASRASTGDRIIAPIRFRIPVASLLAKETNDFLVAA